MNTRLTPIFPKPALKQVKDVGATSQKHRVELQQASWCSHARAKNE
ncbi:hypothetical protein [Rufibacter sp. XAAS-G3-1]|nr:hypothetical protein [Rufibacter sp. XAAS-G3-1]